MIFRLIEGYQPLHGGKEAASAVMAETNDAKESGGKQDPPAAVAEVNKMVGKTFGLPMGGGQVGPIVQKPGMFKR